MIPYKVNLYNFDYIIKHCKNGIKLIKANTKDLPNELIKLITIIQGLISVSMKIDITKVDLYYIIKLVNSFIVD